MKAMRAASSRWRLSDAGEGVEVDGFLVGLLAGLKQGVELVAGHAVRRCQRLAQALALGTAAHPVGVHHMDHQRRRGDPRIVGGAGAAPRRAAGGQVLEEGEEAVEHRGFKTSQNRRKRRSVWAAASSSPSTPGSSGIAVGSTRLDSSFDAGWRPLPWPAPRQERVLRRPAASPAPAARGRQAAHPPPRRPAAVRPERARPWPARSAPARRRGSAPAHPR